MATKWVYSFGKGKAEGKAHQKALLGGKGAGLAEMTSIGLPVPAGFTITTEACAQYYRAGKKWPKGLDRQVRDAIKKLERAAGKKFGGNTNISCSGLNEVETIQKKGKAVATAKTAAHP